MSWVAEQKVIASAQAPTAPSDTAGFCSASSAMLTARAIWVTSIQPRRRPSSGTG